MTLDIEHLHFSAALGLNAKSPRIYPLSACLSTLHVTSSRAPPFRHTPAENNAVSAGFKRPLAPSSWRIGNRAHQPLARDLGCLTLALARQLLQRVQRRDFIHICLVTSPGVRRGNDSNICWLNSLSHYPPQRFQVRLPVEKRPRRQAEPWHSGALEHARTGLLR